MLRPEFFGHREAGINAYWRWFLSRWLSLARWIDFNLGPEAWVNEV